MYSPYDAVYGHDTTYIQRMTADEYAAQLREEEEAEEDRGGSGDHASSRTPSPASQPQKRPAGPHERRRGALSSRNPNVVFSSKYPMYDPFGRELCVAYQIQDVAVQQELRRLQAEHGNGDPHARRSGVRLSAEVQLSPDETATTTTTTTTAATRPHSLAETQPPSLAEEREMALSEEDVSRWVRPSHMDAVDEDSPVDVEVSATSQYPSLSASRTSSRPVSARPSEFSIFRESGGRGAFGKARSSVPARTVADEDKILIHRPIGGGGGGGQLRAVSLPAAPQRVDHEDGDADEGRRTVWGHRAEKRHRSRSSGGRHSRVRFINGDDRDNAENVQPAQPRSAGEGRAVPQPLPQQPKRLLTPPPAHLSESPARHPDESAQEEATRWTTLSRGSAAVRATKQLFRSTTHAASAPRMTTTLTYTQPIASNVYGVAASTIAASKVRAAVEHNVAVCAAALPQHYTDGGSAGQGGAPELCCGAVVQLGDAWYKLVHFHIVADVFEAVRVHAPAEPAEKGGAAAVEQSAQEQPMGPVDASSAPSPAVVEADATAPSSAHQQPTVTADGAQQPPALFATETTPPSTAAPQSDNGGDSQQQEQQFFIYRWRKHGKSRGVDEARRAALGLSLCSPALHVSGFEYTDGRGVTLITVPAGHHAVPLSALPLALRSYTTLLRTVLKAFSALVARRTVHGNITALGDMFLVWPTERKAPADASAATTPQLRGPADSADGRPSEPFLLLFHWENWVDFGMYVDRNAGRTLPFDLEDDAAQSLLYYSRDILSGLQLFLEHPLAAELTSEQYILLQKLIVMAAESTPVAGYLIQMKNLMLTLPTDTAALQQSFETALVTYTP